MILGISYRRFRQDKRDYPYSFAVRDFPPLFLAGLPALHEKYATLKSRILENASFDRESTPPSLCTFESSGLNCCPWIRQSR